LVTLRFDIINTRISHPTAIILLGQGFARFHADLTGAFGFIADNLYNLATAMTFISTTSHLVGKHSGKQSKL
jgi:hypothetical protein